MIISWYCSLNIFSSSSRANDNGGCPLPKRWQQILLGRKNFTFRKQKCPLRICLKKYIYVYVLTLLDGVCVDTDDLVATIFDKWLGPVSSGTPISLEKAFELSSEETVSSHEQLRQHSSNSNVTEWSSRRDARSSISFVVAPANPSLVLLLHVATVHSGDFFGFVVVVETDFAATAIILVDVLDVVVVFKVASDGNKAAVTPQVPSAELLCLLPLTEKSGFVCVETTVWSSTRVLLGVVEVTVNAVVVDVPLRGLCVRVVFVDDRMNLESTKWEELLLNKMCCSRLPEKAIFGHLAFVLCKNARAGAMHYRKF